MGEEAGPQQIRAWGPGLEGGVAGRPAIFVVESVAAEVGVLGESLQSCPRSGLFHWFSADFKGLNILILDEIKGF